MLGIPLQQTYETQHGAPGQLLGHYHMLTQCSVPAAVLISVVRPAAASPGPACLAGGSSPANGAPWCVSGQHGGRV